MLGWAPQNLSREEQEKLAGVLQNVAKLVRSNGVGLLMAYHPKCHACHEMAPVLRQFAAAHRNVWVQAVNIDDPSFTIDKPIKWGPQGRYSVKVAEIDGTPTFVVVQGSTIRAQRAGTLGSRSDFSVFELEAWMGSSL